MHNAVFVTQAVNALKLNNGDKVIDGTAGEGGHLEECLKHDVQLLAIDYDKNQVEKLHDKYGSYSNVKLVHGNFKNIKTVASEHFTIPVNAIILDLGLSYVQIARSGKGLSYQKDRELLDMRLDANIDRSASDILNDYTGDQLTELFSKYAEDVYSNLIANQIVLKRKIKPIQTVTDLKRVIDVVLDNQSLEKKEPTYRRIFQALRIEVNNEIENLAGALADGVDILKPGGRFVIITFHSVEDRFVKRFVTNCHNCKMVKTVVPKNQRKPYERSAQLRVIEKKNEAI